MKKIKYYKFELLLLLFIITLISTYLFVEKKQVQKHQFNAMNNQLTQLLVLDVKLDNFIKNRSKLAQIDQINQYLYTSHQIVDQLIKTNEQMQISDSLSLHLIQLKGDLTQKEWIIERLKFRKAFEFNIRSYLLSPEEKEYNKLSLNLKNKINILRLNILNQIQNNGSLDKYLHKNHFTKNEYPTKYVQNFMKKINALHRSITVQNKLIKEAVELQYHTTISKTNNILFKLAKKNELKNNVIQYLLIFIIIVLIFILIQSHKKLKKTQEYLKAFKTAVENSYNVVVMTDKERNIVFANHMFEKVSGYSVDEALGNNPRVLKSGIQDENFYKEMNDVLDQGKNWKGRFINKDKNGNLFYEDATIAPIFSQGEISGYLAIKNDVTQNVLYEEKLKTLNEELIEKNEIKEKLLIEQTKLATLGQMMDAVAHQWKQPLNIISSYISTLQLQKELDILDDGLIEDTANVIVKQVKHLSLTLDEFRKFFREDHNTKYVKIKDAIESVLDLQKTYIDSNRIEINVNCSDDIYFELIVTEFKHLLINLINNAADAFTENLVEEKYITIDVSIKKGELEVLVTDNAGGIPEKIIDKIFDYNFTTKEKDKGTGIGLYMCQQFIQKSNGEISVENIKHTINDTVYKGAQFSLIFRLNDSFEDLSELKEQENERAS